MASIASPLHWREWQVSLVKHPDEFFARFVVMGTKEGFRVGYDYRSRVCKSSTANMPLAMEGRSEVSAYLAKNVRRVGCWDRSTNTCYLNYASAG